MNTNDLNIVLTRLIIESVHLIKIKLSAVMSFQPLPVMPVYKNTLENQEIATRMMAHRRKISEADRNRRTKYIENQ